MLKKYKKILSTLLAFGLMISLCTSVLGAEIYWDESDMAERNIGSITFDESDASALGGGSIVSGSTVIEGDTSHGNVNSSTGFIYVFGGKLSDLLEEGTKLTIQFDYYATANDNLRVEMRNVATKNGTEAAETQSGQAKYWDATQDLPYMSVVNDGKWHTFKGTIDTKKYLDEFIKIKNDTFTYNKANFMIRLAGGNQIYTDNFSLKAEPAIKGLMSGPAYTYYWTKADSEGSFNNVYKAEVNVSKSSDEFKVYDGQAPAGFFEDGGTYEASFWYKEDSANPYPMMRMWRFKNSIYGQPVWDNGLYLYLTWEPEKEDFGNWIKITNTITLDADDSHDATLINDGKFQLWWNTRDKNWTDDMIGKYTVYFADFELKRTDAVSDKSTTVAFDEDVFVTSGESLEIEVEGYFDVSKAPVLNIDGASVTGSWSEASVVNGKLIKAVAAFDDVTSEVYSKVTPYNATLCIEDIWSRKEINPVNITFTNGAVQKVEVLTGSWDLFASYPNEVDNTLNGGWAYKINFADCYSSGKTLVRVSFDAKGDGTTAYVSDAKQSMRVGNGIYLDIYVPAADLNDGQYHSYSAITDLGGLDRYDEYNVDRVTNDHILYFRKSEGNVNFKNVKFEIFNPDSDVKEDVVSRLKITNTADARFSPEGVLIFGEFDGSQLTEAGYRKISYTDVKKDENTTYYNGLGKDETKYVYCTGYDCGKNGTKTKKYDNSKIYRAFYWDAFDTMLPQVGMNEMK